MLCSNGTKARAFRWLLTAAMSSVFVGALPALAQEQKEADAARKRLAALERFIDLGKRELQKAAEADLDPAGQAAVLDFDAEKEFAFVRDSVRTEPYVGVLRGARGALAGHAGNSADKALLLRAMLEAGGSTARLMTGTLPDEKAGAIVDAFVAADPLAGPLAELVKPVAGDGGLADFAARTGIAPDEMKQIVDDANKQNAELLGKIDAQTAEATTYLSGQLAAAGIKAGQTARQWHDELAARVRPHTWVQYQDAAGKWVDLDPALPDAKPGQTAATGGKPVRGDLPGRHVVSFSLVYTRTTANGPEAQTILTVPVNADEALFRPVDFAVVPVDGLPPVEKLVDMKQEDTVKALAGATKFQAYVRTGEQTHPSKVFDLKGGLFDVGGDGQIQGAGALGKSAGDVFGGMGGGDQPAPAAGTFAALSMTINVLGPQGQPAVPPQTRVLLRTDDLKGEHTLSPILDWQILIQPQPVAASKVMNDQLRGLIDVLDPIVALSKSGGAITSTDVVNVLRHPSAPTPVMPLHWSLCREGALARALKASPDAAVLWDTPQVAASERRFCSNRTTGHTCDRSRFDIVHNGLTLIPRGTDAAAAAKLALRQGVYDTVAERLMLEAVYPKSLSTSAAASLDAVRTGGGKLAVLTPEAAPALSPDDQVMVRTSEAGRQLLASADGKPADAWWSLDPRTGMVVGRVSGGGGQALTEQVSMVAGAITSICVIIAGASVVKQRDVPGGTSTAGSVLAMTKVGLCMAMAGVGAGMAIFGGGAMGFLFVAYMSTVILTGIVVSDEILHAK